jgi:hypothetical protein
MIRSARLICISSRQDHALFSEGGQQHATNLHKSGAYAGMTYRQRAIGYNADPQSQQESGCGHCSADLTSRFSVKHSGSLEIRIIDIMAIQQISNQ